MRPPGCCDSENTRTSSRDPAAGRLDAARRARRDRRRPDARPRPPGDRARLLRLRARRPLRRLPGAGRRALRARRERDRVPARPRRHDRARPGGEALTARLRLGLFLAGGAGFAVLLAWGFAGLPDFGHYAGPYGDILARLSKPQRNIPNVVTATVFDYRGFDTLGEELILLGAVVGTSLLLRQTREHDVSEVADPVRSEPVRALTVLAVLTTFVAALYVTAHGHLTPGGGFQGGVVASAAFLLLFLGADYRTFHSVGRSEAWEGVEGVGAAGFAGLGLLSLGLGLAFLENFLPLGTSGRLTSGGSVLLVNWAASFAVAAGFVLIFGEFLQEAMAKRHPKGRS